MENPLQTLHKSLLKNNYDVPEDYNSFERTLTAKGDEGYQNRLQLWKSLRDNNYDVPDNYDDFRDTLFTAKQPEPATYKPTAREMAGFQQTIGQANQAGKGATAAYDRRASNLQKRQGLRAPQRVTLGESNNLVEGEQHLNPETGELEQSYITSAGNEYQDKTIADQEQRQIDQFVRAENYRKSLPGQLDDAYAERDRLNAELAQHQGQWVDQDGRVHYGNRGDDESVAALEAALRQNQQRITALEAERDDDGGTQFWRGFVDAAMDPSVQTFGLTDFNDMVQLMRVKQKIDQAHDAGQEPELSSAEQKLIESTFLNNDAQQRYGENRGFMYRAGGISMQALPFVAEFMTTGGFSALSEAGAKYGAKAAEKLALDGLSKMFVKNLGVLAGDVAAGWAMANTTGAFRTASDIMQRNMGEVTINPEGQYDFGSYDEEGNFTRGGKSLGRSIYEAEVANTLEYYTEKLGEHLQLGKWIAKGAEKMGLSKLSKAVNYLSSSKWLESGGIQDYPSEVVEEQANLVLNALLVGDNDFSTGEKGVFNAKTQADIWGGMLFSIGLMQAPRLAYTGKSAINYYQAKKTVDMADTNASIVFGEDNWASVKQQIDDCDNEQMGEMIANIATGDMNSTEKTAALNYAGDLLKMRGYNMGMMADAKDEQSSMSEEAIVSQSIDQSYGQGYNAQEPDDMKTIVDEAQASGEMLSSFGEEFSKMVMDGQEEPVQTMNYLMQNRDLYTDEQIAAAADYFQKQAAANGVMDAALDNVDMQVEQANAQVRGNAHQESGNLVMAKMGDLDYYVVGGEITPEGALVGTGGAVLLKDPVTGEISVQSPANVMIYEMTPVDQLIQQNETLMRQQLMQQADDDINFGSPANEVFDMEDTVSLMDGEGGVIEGQVVQLPNAVDGVFVIQTSDGRALQMTADDMNRRVVAHNGAEVERAAAQPAAEAAGGQPSAQAEVQPQPTGQQPGEAAAQPQQPAQPAEGQAETEPAGQPQSALSRIPVKTDASGQPVKGKNGRPVLEWHKATVEDAASALIETTGGDMLTARDTATDLVNVARGKLEKIRKQKPKGEDPIEIAESRRAIKQQEQEQQAIIKHWQDVNQDIQRRMQAESVRKEEERRAALSEEQRRQEDERKRQEKERQDQIAAERRRQKIEEDLKNWNKPYQPLEQAKREMAGDADALSYLENIEPQSLEEWVSSLLRPQSIQWADTEVDGRTVEGLQSELGLNWSDMQRFGGLIGGKAKGKPFGQVVHEIWEDLPEGIKNMYTDQDVRNALLELFNESDSKRMRNLTAEHRIEQAREVYKENQRRAAEYEMEEWAAAYHLTPEERETFEEFMQQPPTEPEQEIIDQIIADYEQSRTSPSMGEQPDNGAVPAGVEGSEGEVQGEGTAASDGHYEEGTPEGSETATGQPPVAHNPVSGESQEREGLRELFRQIGADMSLADRMSDYEVNALSDLVDDWDAVNSNYGEVIEQQKPALQSKNKATRDAAQKIVDEAQAKANEAFEPIEMYIEELNTKYGIESEEPFEGAIPTPKIDNPRYQKIRQDLIDAYASKDKREIKSAVVAIQAYVDEGLDSYGTYSEEADDYEGDDPTMLADQYIIHVFQDRYLDDDEDQEYINTGLKASMRQQNSDVLPTLSNDVSSAEIEQAMNSNLVKSWLKSKGTDHAFNLFGIGSDLIRMMARARLGITNKNQIGSMFNNAAELVESHLEAAGKRGLDDAIAKKYDFHDGDVIQELIKNGTPLFTDEELSEIAKYIKPAGMVQLNEALQAFEEEKLIRDEMERLKTYDNGDAVTKAFALYDIANRRLREQYDGDERFYKARTRIVSDDPTRNNRDITNNPDFELKEGETAKTEYILKSDVARKIAEQIATSPVSVAGQAQLGQTLGKTSTPEEIQAEEAKVDTNPTDAQKEAGNYQKGHINVDGYDITIENPKGSVRRGVDAKGNAWESEMHNTYGYIRGTEGVDGDHIDVFLSDNPTSGKVFVVDQANSDGTFDEHKVMYGFATEEEARQAYLSNYDEGWQGLGAITEVSREDFKKWIESSHRKTKPFAEYKAVKKAATKPQPTHKPAQEPATPAGETAVTTAKAEQPKRLVSDDRMEELKKRLKQKLGGQLNVGVDPEVLAIGAEMAVGYIERGVTKFADYARTMIEEVGDFMRPYLKSFYNAVRDMPEAQEYAGQMDDYQTVSSFDVFNFDKGGKAPTVIEKAEQVTKEQKVRKQAKKIKQEQPDLFGDLFAATEPVPETKPAKAETQPQRKVVKLRPATEADLDGQHPIVYYQGHPYNIIAVVHSGEQVSATQFSKPRVERVVLTNGKDVKLEQLQVEDTSAGTPVKKGKTAWWNDPNRPQSLDLDDYRSYMSDEARAYFASHPIFAGWKRKDLAFVTAAVWDGVVVPYEALKDLPEIVEAEETVKKATVNGVLQINDEERDQHAQHLLDAEHGSAVFDNGKIKKINGVEDFSGPVRQERKALVIIGYPAAGKSSVFANRLSNELGARIIDSDVVKPWLEGFDGGNGAGFVQNASSEVAERAIDIAVGKGDNIILPRIGGNSVIMLSAALKLAGYDVQLYFNDVATVTSVDRATSRFAESGRYLSLQYLTSKDGVPSKNFSKFAEENIGDYINELSEGKLQELRGRLGRLLESETVDGKRLWESSATDQGGYRTLDEYLSVLLEPGGTGVDARPSRLESPIFSYAEWKSNDVAFGEKPKEIWNSKSGKPMPGKEKKNNGTEQKVSRESRAAGEGAGQASRSADRTGAERSPEQDRTERSGLEHSVEIPLTVPDGGEARDSSEGPLQNSTGGITRGANSALPKHNNRRNNVGERGKDYAPLSPKARFNANVEAIKMMRELIEQGIEAPTKDQMEVLRQYSGWGGLGTFFNDENSAENKILRDLLTDEEYNDAALSIKTAYYTPATLIDSLWDIAKAMGFKGGSMLEGSAGIGNIIGQMPKDMSRRSDIEAVELDPISGNILKLLYPDAKVHIQGFQDTTIRNGSVDLAITNVPFAADISVIDKVDKDLSRKFRKLNDAKVKGFTKKQCFEDYQAVQKAVDDVLQQQLSDPDDAALKPKLDSLNKAFDQFVKRYGNLHKNTAISFLRNDIDFPSFQALENYSESKDINGKVTVSTSKAPLFRQRVLGFKTEPQPKTVKDALIASVFRSNGIDLDWIAEKLGEDPEEVRKSIIGSRLGFEDPSTGQLEISYKYLSGNVREKLAIAEAYNTSGETAGRYTGNIEELRKVIPMDIPSHLIDFSLGSSWIPVEMYMDYLKENYDLGNVKLTHVEGSWVLEPKSNLRNEKNRTAGVYSEQFRETIYGHQLVAAALNNRPVKVAKQVTEGYGSSKTTRTVVDQKATQACAVRVDEIKDDFKQWAKKKMQENPELAQRIEKIYNDKFNALVPMEISDEFLPDTFENANVNIHLYGHQKRGVMRGVTAPTMLAHEVGTGKSFTLISTAMEMRRLGTAQKPMVVVQNATVAQMTADAKLLYPNAKLLSLSEKDRSAEGRRAFYAKIRYNDWDLIIVPQSTFERIPDSPERELQFIQEKIDEKKHVIEAAEAAGMDDQELKRLKRELEKYEQEYGDKYLDEGEALASQKKKKKDAKKEATSLDKAETRAKEQLDRAVDDVQYFDDMGVDALLVDEAHEYKHLGFQTSIGRGIKGIDPSYSKKCAGLYNKTRSVFEKAGWKNVVFATGTPISNTAAEIWTFMKYLMPADVMRANDIYYFDDFVHNFGSIQQMLEFTTSGKFKENTRFAAYVNKPELIRIWSQVADTVLTKEVGAVNAKIPEEEGGKDQDKFLPQSPSLISIMAAVRKELERFENMTGQQKKENSHIPLTMYGIAKRAAIDPRLVNRDAPDEPLSKTNAAVKEIVQDLKDTESYKGTVAVFCDNQNRKNDAGIVDFNIFEDMRDKLIAQGVPAEQIVIIKSGMSIAAKQKVFDAVNSGSIRVVLGSTQTLGTGVNMQERLHLLIHMDAPDRPMDYTQRNGRIKRQGNSHKQWGKTIRVIRFGVEDSLDVTAYQRLKTKSGFIDSIMDGKSALANNQVDRTVEEEEEGLFDNPVAVLSGSQYALKKNQAERELRKYQGKKAQHEADQVYVTNTLRYNKAAIEGAKSDIADEQKQLEHIKSLFPDGKVKTITVEGVKVDMSRGDASAYGTLSAVIKEKINDPVNAIVKRNRENQIYNDESLTYTIELDGHPVNFKVDVARTSEWDGSKMKNVIHKYTTYSSPDLLIENQMNVSKGVRDHLDEILEQVVSGNDYQDRITAMQQRIERIQNENEQLEKRVGLDFPFEKELKEAEKRVEEYTELMKKELEEKEAKYANQQTEAVDLSSAEENEEDDDVRYREQERFEDGQLFPIHTAFRQSSYNVLGGNRSYSIDLMPDEYASEQSLLDAVRRQYPAYYARIEDGQLVMDSWTHVMEAADAAMQSQRNGRDKGKQSYIERKTRNAIDAVTNLAQRMNLDVEVLITTDGLTGKKARAKGWFNPKTGKITLVLPNHSNQDDLINTLLHEGVAHYGLRHLFGSNFDTFLDNVYNNVSPDIKARIDAAIKRNGWSQREATEEYLARLAERTDFEHATEGGWWQKIKDFFFEMLGKAGFNTSLTDNELRYILWRSYDNLLHPDSRRNIFDKAREVQMQSRLRVGPYSERERQRIQRTGRIDTSLVATVADNVNEDFSLEDYEKELFSIRTKEPPKKTGIGYKVFVLKDGQLYPPMVANPGGEGTPVGVWLDADAAPVAGTSKTGRPQVKAGGKGTQGGSGQLAYRPGWHLGTIPYALQFNRKDASGERTLFPNNFVWAEVEYADDVDYQDEARQEGINANGKYQHSLAGLKHVPTDGSYKYRTNPDPRTDEWIITGAMRVNKILNRDEVDNLVRQAGREPQPIQAGDILTQEAVDELNAEIQATKEADEMGLLMRDDSAWDDVAKESYEKEVATKSLQWQESWQDSMASLKAIQDAIAKETGNVATGAEDAYHYENRMHGRAKNMTEQYDWRFCRPMLKAFNDFCKAKGLTHEQGMDYLIAKSGLERNVYYAFRDAVKAKLAEDVKDMREKLEKDYSKSRISEDEYKSKKADIDLLEQTGVDDRMQQVRGSDDYLQAKEDYANGDISYNEYMTRIEDIIRRETDGKYDEYLKDYSGLTETFNKETYDAAQRTKKKAQRTIDPQERRELWGEYDAMMKQAYEQAREEAEKRVFDAEGGDGQTVTSTLWKRINAATEETLKHSYESGLMDRNTYHKVRKMFDFYLPLRGWDENKASDVYTYMGRENVFSPAVKKTWGRTSKAEDPLAYIGNIAVSTILSGHRNMLKQHFLNYVMNNPTSLVSISESWYENIGTEDDHPVWVLRSADTAGKEPDEIAQIVNDFNEEMRLKQNEGKAIPVRGRLRLDVNATQGQKAEHAVEVQRAGRTYQLYINGNPKAAQALNGSAARAVSRISDTYLGRKLNALNRSMAAFFTSKNPAFVVSNLSRDLNMAGASVAINEGAEYNARFIANVAKVLSPRVALGDVGKVGLVGLVGKGRGVTGLMPKLMSKWKAGKLDANDETERLFKEFMDEGGETGFVNMLSVESFKEKMHKEIAQMNGSSLFGSKGQVKEFAVTKALRMLGDTFEFYNRCAEDATRFIVYMTSRQMGKTLEQSIADAKDVTLNFNRKGTGDKGNAEVRDLFIFVNPAIQALANMYRMAKGHPLKFGVVTAGFVAAGALMPVINQWLLNILGDDDDKDAYWNLPPWVRKNNLVFWVPGTKNFVTLPLAQEFRVFYGVGEMISSGVMDHPLHNAGLEVVSSVADLVPINPTGNGGNLLVDFAPTGVQPIVQIGENVDFTGKPIWKDNQGNKFDPMFSKAYVSTPQWMVKISEGINSATGGDQDSRGWLERNTAGAYLNNPAVWNHLLQGYFGGMYNTIAKTFDVAVTVGSGEAPKVYQTPVLNRFLNRPVERDNAGVLGEEYWKQVEDAEETMHNIRKKRQRAADGDAEAQQELEELLQTNDGKKAETVLHYKSIIDVLRKGERSASEKEDKQLMKTSISSYAQQMHEELMAIDGGLEPLDAAMQQFEEAKTTAEKKKLQKRIEKLMTGGGGRTSSASQDVEKAKEFIEDSDAEAPGADAYLNRATAEDIKNDGRIKAAKSSAKPYTQHYKELNDAGKTEEASLYRQEHQQWFTLDAILKQQTRLMNQNKKLLGKGHDAAIMKLISNNRNAMLRAIDEIDNDKQ